MAPAEPVRAEEDPRPIRARETFALLLVMIGSALGFVLVPAGVLGLAAWLVITVLSEDYPIYDRIVFIALASWVVSLTAFCAVKLLLRRDAPIAAEHHRPGAGEWLILAITDGLAAAMVVGGVLAYRAGAGVALLIGGLLAALAIAGPTTATVRRALSGHSE